MKNVFIVNAGMKRADGNGGKLNLEMVEIAKRVFETAGYNVVITDLNNEWKHEEEIQKILNCDLFILQTPIWAMTTPWQYTKYQDEVLTDPKVCGTDGRTRSDPSKKYGSGGFLTDKFYFLATTWNAPLEALNMPGEFFDGRGIEEVLMPLHKQFAYMGIKPLTKSFSINDVYKNPTIESDLKRYEEFLTNLVKNHN